MGEREQETRERVGPVYDLVRAAEIYWHGYERKEVYESQGFDIRRDPVNNILAIVKQTKVMTNMDNIRISARPGEGDYLDTQYGLKAEALRNIGEIHEERCMLEPDYFTASYSVQPIVEEAMNRGLDYLNSLQLDYLQNVREMLQG